MNILNVRDLNFSYKNNSVLKNISFNLSPGLHALIGANGSGKTTLMKILSTLQDADSGTISLSGISYENALSIRKNISYVPQVFNAYNDLKVYEFINFMASLRSDSEKVSFDFSGFGIDKFSSKKLKELSEGMKKKVLIVSALIKTEKMIIMDEPTSGLDKESREELTSLLVSVSNKNPNIIVLYSTHLKEDIVPQISSVLKIAEGELVSLDKKLFLSGEKNVEII